MAITVDTLVDEVDGVAVGGVSLRDALAAATSGEIIEFSPGLTSSGPARITLVNGELTINTSLTINGPGASLLTIDAAGNDPTPSVDEGNGSRAFNIDDGSTTLHVVAINGMTITGGDAMSAGGGIFTYESLSLTNCVVIGNATSVAENLGGGGVYSSAPARMLTTLSLTNCNISNNSAANAQGGGVRKQNGSLTVEGCTFIGNSAITGGAVSGKDSFQRALFRDSTFSQNSGTMSGAGGGAIYIIEDGRNTDFINCVIKDNSARLGAGLYVQGGILTLDGSTVSGNTASQAGGGIHFGGINLSLNRSTVSGNAGTVGGGIYSGVTYVTDSVVRDNTASRDGGGISGTRVTIVGSTVRGNSARNGGGVTAVTPAIFRSVITGNTASGNGGGINATTTTVESSVISDNSSAVRGGGIWSRDLMVFSSTISGNTAVDGGGLAGNALEITSSKLEQNAATGAGGGAWASESVSFLTSRLNRNSADIGGGTSSNSVLVRSSTFYMNSANFGGAIDGKRILITSSALSFNSAAADGGGLYTRGGADNFLSIVNSTIRSNAAAGVGGGLYLFGPVQWSLRHSAVMQNTAGDFGGGVFVASGTLALDHTVLAGNMAPLGTEISPLFGALVTAKYSLVATNDGAPLAEAPVGSPDPNGNLIGGPVNGIIHSGLSPWFPHGQGVTMYEALPGSPVVNAGSPTATPGVNGVPTTDQRGSLFVRVSGGRIDIGPFEAQPLPPASADFDRDGDVDGSDFLQWQRGLGIVSEAATFSLGDADNDSNVNAADLARWKSAFVVASPSSSGGEPAASIAPSDSGWELTPQIIDAAMAYSRQLDAWPLTRWAKRGLAFR